MDVLLALALEGPQPKSRLIRVLGLSKKAVRDYVDGFLVARGFIAVAEMGGVKLYSITRLGVSYLTAVLLAAPENWPPLDTLEELAARLRERGLEAEAPSMVDGTGSVALPVDLVIRLEEGRSVPVYVGFTPAEGLARLYLACMARLMGMVGDGVVAAVPREALDAAARISGDRCSRLARIAVHAGTLDSAATAIEEAVATLSEAAGGGAAGRPRRVVI